MSHAGTTASGSGPPTPPHDWDSCRGLVNGPKNMLRADVLIDPRPCKGTSANASAAEGCTGEARRKFTTTTDREVR